jgi:hypothetical protein
MSEILRLPESECARARGMLCRFVDGDLTPEQSAWLNGHLEACAECAAELARFAGIDSELTGWGQRVELQNPPPPGARNQLATRLGSIPVRRRAIRWIPAAAAVIAAALALATIAPRRKPPAVNREPAPFVAIPYLPPLDPRENTAIVRMNIRVATLIAAGYRVAGDPEAIVPAEVLVGEDGRAHAVRVLSGIGWN